MPSPVLPGLRLILSRGFLLSSAPTPLCTFLCVCARFHGVAVLAVCFLVVRCVRAALLNVAWSTCLLWCSVMGVAALFCGIVAVLSLPAVKLPKLVAHYVRGSTSLSPPAGGFHFLSPVLS